VEGVSCKPSTQAAIEKVLAEQRQFSWVSNGRFKGGYITRHYCDVGNAIETIQLELSQSTYMDEQYLVYDEEKARRVQRVIREIFAALL
jgi:N-formylglutamate deformylase